MYIHKTLPCAVMAVLCCLHLTVRQVYRLLITCAGHNFPLPFTAHCAILPRMDTKNIPLSQRDAKLYELLKGKDILDILDGDTKFEEYEFEDNHTVIPVSMPYLSGPKLCEISTQFGLAVTYQWQGMNPSRWQYISDLIDHCITTQRISDLLAYLFAKPQFNKLLSGHTSSAIDEAYRYFVETIIGKINGVLYFGGNELVTITNQFIIRPIVVKVELLAPKIKSIDREYIKSIYARAIDDVEQNNFDSAITKSRTLLEEVFCCAIEKKNEVPGTSGNINDLYKTVKRLYNMHSDGDTDKRIKELLSGLEKIVSAISEMRNKDSDAHGVGLARINISEHHARLIINAAITMADFILSVSLKANSASVNS